MAAADGSHGYVQAGAVDALKALLRGVAAGAARAGDRRKLRIRQEAGSPFMGLV